MAQESSPAHPGLIVEELGAGHAREQEGNAFGELGDVADEFDELRLGPLEVVEHEDDGSLGRHSLEQHADCPHLLGRGPAARDSDRLTNALRDAIGQLASARERRELAPGGLRRVGLIEVRRLDQRFGQRMERDPLPVRQTPAAQDGRTTSEALDEGGHQPRLADAPDAEHREDPAPPVGLGSFEGVAEKLQLVFPPDHGRVEVTGEPGRARRHLDEAKGGHRIGLALRAQRRPARRSPHRARGQRCVSHQDLAGRRGLLQPRRDVHRVSRHDLLVAHPGHHLAGVHPDPAGQRYAVFVLHIRVQRGQLRAHLARGMDRPRASSS